MTERYRDDEDPSLTDDDFEPISAFDENEDEADDDIWDVAESIFAAVEEDLRDRAGIGDAFEGVDDTIIDEVRETNVDRIYKILKRMFG